MTDERQVRYVGKLRFEPCPELDAYFARHNKWYRRVYRWLRWHLWARRRFERTER